MKEKLEQLNKKREELTKKLQELDSQYKLGIRNLDRIDGAIFILKETLEGEGVKSEFKEVRESIETQSIEVDKS